MEERRGFTIKSLLVRLILIIIFIFLLIWLFPMPNLKPLNNQIFADNVDRMKDVAKSYYTTERLPENIGDYKKMTLKEMLDLNLILPLMDSKGKYCSKEDSYVKIEKMENEYLITVYLSCSDKKAMIKEHFGCYDICSDTCKALEKAVAQNETTTTYKVYSKARNTTKRTTTGVTTTWVTTKKGKLYEYQFVKNDCKDVFDKYVCPAGYSLIGDVCMLDDTDILVEDSTENKSIISNVDTQDAKAVASQSTDVETKTPTYTIKELPTQTLDAGYHSETYTTEYKEITDYVTASSDTHYDIKPAISHKEKVSYKVEQVYDEVAANVSYPNKTSNSKWVKYKYKVSLDGTLAFYGDKEYLELVDSWQEAACPTCQDSTKMVTYYKYVGYKLVDETDYGTPVYSCNSGYTLHGTVCRSESRTVKSCPSGYTDTGSDCVAKTATYNCSSYDSSYKYNASNKTCVKTTINYSCEKGNLVNTNQCEIKKYDYTCPVGMVKEGTGKDAVCKKYTYYCNPNTDSITYTLNGSKCTANVKVKVASCDNGYTLSDDKKTCVKNTEETVYTCNHLDGYTLQGNKCTKVINTEIITYSCPDTYTLNNDDKKCYKTARSKDTKAATKTYISVCEEKYKWSTSAQVDGWSYTGNKREVNY